LYDVSEFEVRRMLEKGKIRGNRKGRGKGNRKVGFEEIGKKEEEEEKGLRGIGQESGNSSNNGKLVMNGGD
jgi:hypothetical protein